MAYLNPKKKMHANYRHLAQAHILPSLKHFTKRLETNFNQSSKQCVCVRSNFKQNPICIQYTKCESIQLNTKMCERISKPYNAE